jgi:hypothetical protein
MKKIFRTSQIKEVLGRRVYGLHMHKYGLPYNGASGTFFPKQEPDSIDLMLAAVDRYFPEIHVVSKITGGNALNRYVEGADFYDLYTGNTDPDIEFTPEILSSDYTEEEKESGRKMLEDFHNNPPDEMDVAAVNWLLQKMAKRI